MSKLTIKEVFAVCRDKHCSINGAPISRLVDENLRRERSMFKLAQADTKTKVQFADRNGKPNGQVAKLKKDLTYAQKEIAKLKNQPNQAKQNMATEGLSALDLSTGKSSRVLFPIMQDAHFVC